MIMDVAQQISRPHPHVGAADLLTTNYCLYAGVLMSNVQYLNIRKS